MPTFLQSLLGDLRAMPRGVWVLVGGQFINRFGSFVFPFLTLYLKDHDFSSGQVATVLIAIAVGQLPSPFVAGYLADAIGRRNTMVVALVGGAVTLLGIYACNTHVQLLAAGAVHGFFAFMYGPPANALLTDLVAPEKRVTAHALLRVALNGGFAAGPAVAGLLYDPDHALPLFAGDAGTTLVFALLAWFFLPHGLRTIAGRVTSPRVVLRSWREAAGDALRNGPYVQWLVAMLLMAVAFNQIFSVLALHADARGLSPATYGLVMSLNGFLIMLVELPLAHWLTRFPPQRVLIVGYTLTAAGCASFAFAREVPAFFAAMALFTLGEMVAIPVGSGYGALLAPKAYRGRYSGFQAAVWSCAALAGSTGVWFYDQLGPVWWEYSGGIGLLAAVAMVFRLRDRRVAAQQTAPVAVAGQRV